MKKLFTLLLAAIMVLSLAACDAKHDAEYIKGNGKVLVGITIYEPMNYYDEAGNLTGFDTEFAQAVCEKLGLKAEFVEINWDTKEVELNAKSIDCIWNGMTITEERAANMSISVPYVKNAQVIVVKADSAIVATADLIGKTVVAEIGSAGEAQIKGEDANADLAQAEYVGMAKQTDCLMEVKAGTADAAVLDWTLAKSMVGEGTDFADLKMVADLELATEEYGIAFRKDSNFTAEVDAAIKALVADGTLPALAEKYGLALAPAIAG
ncbi:MAG: transporter substrate-binding domain-containing protein [Ruminococcaceae bacterium]|nr:transporter substrate-binding domain-containing protein [Oscillospiraceae bacterium]